VKSPVFRSTNSAAWIRFSAGNALYRRSDGISTSYGQAFAKAQLAAGQKLPRTGTVFISVNDRDKRKSAPWAKNL